MGEKTAQREYQSDGMIHSPGESGFGSPNFFLIGKESQYRIGEKKESGVAHWNSGIELRFPTIPVSNPQRRMFIEIAPAIQEIFFHFFNA